MAQTGIQRRLSDGEIIIREGASTDSLIFMLEGELLVTTRRLGQIARLGVGEVVGEISLVDSAPHRPRASGNGLALFLDKTKLMQKLDKDDGFGSRFYHALAVFLLTDFGKRVEARLKRHLGRDGYLGHELDVGILDRVLAPETI
jgi:CRP-like cAMP-binding protein